MNVIPADLSHVDYLSDFGGRSFIHAYQCTLPVEELRAYVGASFAKSTIREEIETSSATYFVCYARGAPPCGYAKLIPSPTPACIESDSGIELQRLYVHSDVRGQGVGRLLATHAESYAQEQGISDIWLRVWEGNEVAQQIYEHWGYTTVGNEYYQVGDDGRTVLLMHKFLKN